MPPSLVMLPQSYTNVFHLFKLPYQTERDTWSFYFVQQRAQITLGVLCERNKAEFLFGDNLWSLLKQPKGRMPRNTPRIISLCSRAKAIYRNPVLYISLYSKYFVNISASHLGRTSSLMQVTNKTRNKKKDEESLCWVALNSVWGR